MPKTKVGPNPRRCASLIEAAAARSNKNEKKGGTDPDSANPSVVVDKSIQEREARGDHRRW
jgi:hypothetical protein